MIKYKFKALSLKTGKEVVGDLIYANTMNEKIKVKPMIVSMYVRGGMLWATDRTYVDEGTIEPIIIKE